MRPVNTDELPDAMRWFRKLSDDKRAAIIKAMRSVDKCGVDGTWVLVASYRMYNRMMADTVPA